MKPLFVSQDNNNPSIGDTERKEGSYRALAQLSPNLIHTFGKCRQRLRLSQRMRFTAIDDKHCIDRYRRAVEQTLDDYIPDTTAQFAKYLDLLATDRLKRQPFSRLQSRHPLRQISRVSLRPTLNNNSTTAQDISSLDLCSYLRRVCFRSVESMNAMDMESKTLQTEIYCDNSGLEIERPEECVDTCVADGDGNNGSADGLDTSFGVVLKKSSVVLTPLEMCPNCHDLVFNRSKKNSIKHRYHSCLKGKVNHEITDVLMKITF